MRGEALCLLAVAAAVGGDDEGPTHFNLKEHERCDRIVDGWGYLGLKLGEAGPVKLTTAVVDGQDEVTEEGGVPLSTVGNIAYRKNVIAYTDVDPTVGGGYIFVKAVLLDNADKLFLPKDDFDVATTPTTASSFLSWSSVNQWQEYKRNSMDIQTTTLTRQSTSARHVTTDGTSVAWVDSLDGGWDIFVYTRSGVDSVPWKQHVLPEKDEMVAHRVLPTLCAGRLLYVEVGVGNTSVLVSYDVASSSLYRYENGGYNVARVTSWAASASDECGFAWAEVPGDVILAESEDDLLEAGYTPWSTPSPAAYPIVLPKKPADLTSTTIAFETFPEQSLTHHNPPASTTLTSITGGGSRLYYTVRHSTGEHQLYYTVPTDNATRVLVYSSDEYMELRFGVTDGVVFRHNGTYSMHRLETEYVAEHVPQEVRSYTCDLGVAYGKEWKKLEKVGMMGGYLDQIVMRVEGEGVLERLDLDKDNDGLFDGQDRYPLQTEFSWDDDNDGVPDEADLVPLSGYACTRRIFVTPSTCLHDIPIMWMIWGGVTVIVFTTAMLIGYNRAGLLELSRFIEAPSISEDTDERILQLVDENVGSKQQIYDTLEGHMSKVTTYKKVETIVQLFLLILTLFSVVLVIIPLWDKEHLPTRLLSIFTWIDVYTAMIFATDLIFRWVYREDKEVSFKQFFIDNWFDFPSLLCDVPGLTNTGSLDLFVIARLLRAIRILKVFRVMRLYRKVTNQSAYLSLVLNHSSSLLPMIALVLLITVAVVLKIVEQDDQPDFESYWNCLWFCFVTATTVGYGDMTPKHVLGRLLACLLMVSGIGMIGNITARVSEKISQTGYQRAQEQERQDRHEDHPAIRLALLELSVTFNPMLALKDFRQEYVDVLNKHYMSPRYMEAAIHQTQAEKIENEILKNRPKRNGSLSMSTIGSMPTGSIPSLTDVSVHEMWCGDGKKGAIVKAAFVRKNGSVQATLCAKDFSTKLVSDPEFRRLRRTITQTEQVALDEVLHDLHEANDKLVDWAMLEDQLVKTQEYHDELATDVCFRQKQLEWNWYKWSEYGAVQKLRNMRKERNSTVPMCMDKLYLILLRYKLDESYKGVDNWETMYKRLCALIFRQPRKNGLVLEKMFSIGCFEYGMGDLEDNPLETEEAYDWQDPIDEVLAEAESILRQHNVHWVEGFHEILLAVESVVMQFDRLETARWALHHLEWGKSGMVTIIPRPPLLEERGRTNVLNPLLHIPRTHRCQHRIGAGGQVCKKLLIMTKGHYEKVDALDGDSVADSVRTTMDDHVLQCHGGSCLSKRRLREEFGASIQITDLEDDLGGYLACPDGHFFLCNTCAANCDHDGFQNIAVQSSRGSSTSSVGRRRKPRPYANAPTVAERPAHARSLEGVAVNSTEPIDGDLDILEMEEGEEEDDEPEEKEEEDVDDDDLPQIGIAGALGLGISAVNLSGESDSDYEERMEALKDTEEYAEGGPGSPDDKDVGEETEEQLD